MEIDQATYQGFLLGQDLLLYDPAKRRRVLCSSSDLGGSQWQWVGVLAAGHQNHHSLKPSSTGGGNHELLLALKSNGLRNLRAML